MDQEIGRRLRDIRTRMKLSQRQLARQSGVANATISQIEAGKLNPTVSMLKRVLDGMEQWDSFVDLVNHLNEIIRLQEEARDSTRETR